MPTDAMRTRETPTWRTLREDGYKFLDADCVRERVLEYDQDLALAEGQYDYVNCLVYTSNGDIMFRWDSAYLAREEVDHEVLKSVMERYWEATRKPVHVREHFKSVPRQQPFEVLAAFRVGSGGRSTMWTVAGLLDDPPLKAALISAVLTLLGEYMTDYQIQAATRRHGPLPDKYKSLLRTEVRLARVRCGNDVRMLDQVEMDKCVEAAVRGEVKAATSDGKMVPTYYVEDLSGLTTLATLPADLLIEIRDYIDPAHEPERYYLDLGPRREYVEAGQALSLVCRRLRRWFQPIVFRYLRLIGPRQVARVFETLNGSRSMWMAGPKPGDAPIVKQMWDKGAAAIHEIEPVMKDDNLRSAVEALSIQHVVEDMGSPTDVIDLRFILQLVPNLRSFWLCDQNAMHERHLLDKTSRVLRKFHNLEHFGYSHGLDLEIFYARNPVFRSIGNMSRLRTLSISDCRIGRDPWIMPSDLGVDPQPLPIYSSLFGPLYSHIWWKPKLIVPEPPPYPRVPRHLTTVSLRRVDFLPPKPECTIPPHAMAQMMKMYSPLVKKRKQPDTKASVKAPWFGDDDEEGYSDDDYYGDDNGEEVDEHAAYNGKGWKRWPSAVHPFSRLLLTSVNTLHTLRLYGVRGLPSHVIQYVMSRIGPRLIELELCGSTDMGRRYALSFCTSLQILTLDTRAPDWLMVDDQAVYFEQAVPPTLRRLNLRRHWIVPDLVRWIESPRRCEKLEVLSISTWGGGFLDLEMTGVGQHKKLLGRLCAACDAQGVKLELPDDPLYAVPDPMDVDMNAPDAAEPEGEAAEHDDEDDNEDGDEDQGEHDDENEHDDEPGETGHQLAGQMEGMAIDHQAEGNPGAGDA